MSAVVRAGIIWGKPYSPSWRGVPPHMASGDYPIWQRYLDSYSDQYESIYYDVILPVEFTPPPDTPSNMIAMWVVNTGKRIDAVGMRSGLLDIIEVRVQAGAGALGAIQIYLSLFTSLYTEGLPFQGVIVSDQIDRVIEPLAKFNSIKLIEV